MGAHDKPLEMTFYRCHLCSGVVSQWDIKEYGACPRCSTVKVSPTNLTFWEKVVQILKHPLVWRWRESIHPDA